jgi:hypothetical protein
MQRGGDTSGLQQQALQVNRERLEQAMREARRRYTFVLERHATAARQTAAFGKKVGRTHTFHNICCVQLNATLSPRVLAWLATVERTPHESNGVVDNEQWTDASEGIAAPLPPITASSSRRLHRPVSTMDNVFAEAMDKAMNDRCADLSV